MLKQTCARASTFTLNYFALKFTFPSALRTISGICQFLPYKPLINTELLPCHTQSVNCVSQFGTWVNSRFNKSQMAVCCNFGYFHIVFGYFHRSSHTELCNLFHLLLFQHMSIYI